MPDVAEIASTRDQIERRAYELYLSRGCQDGSDLADWLSAEKELNEMTQEPTSRPAASTQSSARTSEAVMQEPKTATQKIFHDGKSKTAVDTQQAV